MVSASPQTSEPTGAPSPLERQKATVSKGAAQSCAGIPVATLAIGAAGAANAGILAASILAVSDEDLAARLRRQRETMAEKVAAKSEAAQAKLPSLL